MKATLVALVSGTLFGAGLAVAQMTNPAKVIGFLNVAGAWDPSLAFVMGSALAVSALIARFQARSATSGASVSQPSATAGIDGRLLSGAAIFGVGWGDRHIEGHLEIGDVALDGFCWGDWSCACHQWASGLVSVVSSNDLNSGTRQCEQRESYP